MEDNLKKKMEDDLKKNKKIKDSLKKIKKWKTTSTIKKSTLIGCEIIVN